MKKIMLLMLVMIFIGGCANSNDNASFASENITDDNSNEQQTMDNLSCYSLEEAGLKFAQTYPVKIEGENVQLINIHEDLDNCELEICTVPKEKGLQGETILFSNNMEEPLLIAQLYKHAEIENDLLTDNIIWTNDDYSLVNLNTIIEEGNDELAGSIIANMDDWIFDARQAVGEMVTSENMPSNEDLSEIKVDGLNCYLNVDYLLPSLDIETNRGCIYLPQLSEAGDAYIISLMYAKEDDVDYNNVVFDIIQIFNKQKTYDDAYFVIDGNEYDFDLLKEHVIYENNEILVIDIMPYVYQAPTLEESLALQTNGAMVAEDLSFANEISKQIKEKLITFYNDR